MRYHTRNVNNLNKLANATKAAAFKWYQYCLDNNIEILIYETIRTIEQQREYVRKGASKTMQSYHLVGQALDFVPIKANGAEDWNGYRRQPWLAAINYAKKLGFEWGGDWKGFVDSPHLQWNHYGYGTDTFGGGSVNTGSQSAQKVGIGIATSKYPEGYGVNLYSSSGADRVYTGVITRKIPYLILEAAWYGGSDTMIFLGKDAWAKLEHFNVTWFYAYSKYPKGYGINTYDGPNGNYTGRVDGSYPYQLFARKSGYLDLGNSTWVKEEHFDVK